MYGIILFHRRIFMCSYKYIAYSIRLMLFLFMAMIIFSASAVTAHPSNYDVNDLLTPAKIGNDDYVRYDIPAKLLQNEFKLYEIGDRIVCFYQRKIDDAIVEKDFLDYQFDKNTGTLVKKLTHWRTDLPYQHLPPLSLSRDEANQIALSLIGTRSKTQLLRNMLYIISPESAVFPVRPYTTNPSWIVRLMVDGRQTIAVLDAITKEYKGNGIVPPDHGFALSGPQYDYPCSGAWVSWYYNAAYWFGQWGYPVTLIEWPRLKEMQSQVEDPESVLFYELAHGGYSYFVNGCIDGNSWEFTTASHIESWIANVPAKSFAFIGSCEGMCYTEDNSFSYEFRKGLHQDTFTVGYCGMSTAHCDYCWPYSIDWQSNLFYYMKLKYSAKNAFDSAQADYPTCAEDPACMRFAGDDYFVLPIKEYLLLQKAYPHIRLDWSPPNASNILYSTSPELPFIPLLDGVYPSAYHTDALLDSNNYFYLYELM